MIVWTRSLTLSVILQVAAIRRTIRETGVRPPKAGVRIGTTNPTRVAATSPADNNSSARRNRSTAGSGHKTRRTSRRLALRRSTRAGRTTASSPEAKAEGRTERLRSESNSLRSETGRSISSRWTIAAFYFLLAAHFF